MKAYKERKANEPDDSPEAKPSKKGSVKEFFSKKGDKKKSSPRKSAGGESQKFKSAEFVDTDDSSSEDEGKVRCLCVVAFATINKSTIFSHGLHS